MTATEGWIASADGTELFWRRQEPAAAPRAVLLLVHGLAEHSGRYEHVASRYADRGFDCWRFDYRGHGRSPGPRVHVERFDEFLEDVAAARDHVAEVTAGLPLVMVGHSQGGLLTLRLAVMRPGTLAGVIVSSPFLGIHPAARPSAPLQIVANILSTFAKKLMFSKVAEPTFISRDPAVVDAYVADPLVSTTVSARWFTEVEHAQADTMDRAPELAVPALIMQSGDDRLVDPDATRRWAAAAPEHLAEFVEWPGLYHEMFNEPERDQVFERMDQWLDRLLASDRHDDRAGGHSNV
jgi:alpha-beta hydrolase superfamily lysophospholipase